MQLQRVSIQKKIIDKIQCPSQKGEIEIHYHDESLDGYRKGGSEYGDLARREFYRCLDDLTAIFLRLAGIGDVWDSQFDSSGVGTRLTKIEFGRTEEEQIKQVRVSLENFQGLGSKPTKLQRVFFPATNPATRNPWDLGSYELEKIGELEFEAQRFIEGDREQMQVDLLKLDDSPGVVRSEVPEELADLEDQLQKQIDDRDPLAAALQEENEEVGASV